MKKLISILSVISLTTTSISTVAACTVPVAAIEIYVNGEKPSGTYDSNLKTGILANTSFQLLNAITYTDEKYQDVDTRDQFKKILGTEGLNLSLDQQLTKKTDKNEAETEFLASYNAARNTNFKDFSFNSDLIGTYSIKNIKPFLQEVVQDNTESETKTTYGKISVSETKTLEDLSKDTETNADLSNVKLDDISIFGFEAKDLTNTITTSRAETEIVNQEVTDNFSLSPKEDNTIDENFFYYSNVNLKGLDMTYSDPGEKKGEEVEYEINYTNLTGMVIRWQLTYATLSSKTENKVTTSNLAYWFEPTAYQFTLQPLASNNTNNLFNAINDDFALTITKK